METKCPVCNEPVNPESDFRCKSCGWPVGWLRVPLLTRPSEEWTEGVKGIIDFSRYYYGRTAELERANELLRKKLRENLLREAEFLKKEVEKAGRCGVSLREERESLEEVIRSVRQLDGEENFFGVLEEVEERLKAVREALNEKITVTATGFFGGGAGQTKELYYRITRNDEGLEVTLSTDTPPIPPLKFVARDDREPVGVDDGIEVYSFGGSPSPSVTLHIPRSALEKNFFHSLESVRVRPFCEDLQVVITKY